MHLDMGFKPTEDIQAATQNLLEIAEVTIPVHGTYGGEEQCRNFLPSLFSSFPLIFQAVVLKGWDISFSLAELKW